MCERPHRLIGHVHMTPDIFKITHFFPPHSCAGRRVKPLQRAVLKHYGFRAWVREDGRPILVKTYAVSEISGFVLMHTVWNSLCHGPDITPERARILLKNGNMEGYRVPTRSVYIEYQDPYSSWIELFLRHGVSDIRTRQWNAACQDL